MILDLVIVGAGPAGLACACRASELGLSYVVIEKGRRLVQGIVDSYPRGKSVYATVPRDEEPPFAVPGLAPDPDKRPVEDYVAKVESFAADRHLNVRLGEELADIAKSGKHLVAVTSKERIEARAVVMAFGSNVPIDLGVYGEAKTVARTLDAPEDHLGAPTLVLGGGNSAADVVATLSRFKRENGDSTPVYWGIRRTTVKVEKDVARDLGEEILLGGNIKILQGVRPRIGEVDEGGVERLIIHTQDLDMGGGVLLQQDMSFPMKHVIASIGTQGPSPIFRKFGLQQITCTRGICKIGKEGSDLLLLSTSLETSMQGVFAVGGAISPSYMRIEGHGTLTEQKHPNLIYTAVRDGVAVAESVAARKAQG